MKEKKVGEKWSMWHQGLIQKESVLTDIIYLNIAQKKILKALGSQCAKHSLQELEECLDQQWSLRTLTGAPNVNK